MRDRKEGEGKEGKGGEKSAHASSCPIGIDQMGVKLSSSL